MLRALVIEFNQRVLGVAKRHLIGWQKENDFRLSLTQLREEVNEAEEAYQNGDFVKLIDAFIDLDYFLKGVVYKHGLTVEQYQELFVLVHEANMEKKLGINHNRPGFDGAADAVKPEGWIPPEDRIRAKLNEWGMDLDVNLGSA